MVTQKSTSFLEYLGETITTVLLFYHVCNCITLYFVFRVLGTPSNSVWPGVEELPDFKPNFPQWTGKPLTQVVSKLGNCGCELLQVSGWLMLTTVCGI